MTLKVLRATLGLYAVAAVLSLGSSLLGGAVNPWSAARAVIVGGLAVLALRAWADWTPSLATIAFAAVLRIYRGADAGTWAEGIRVLPLLQRRGRGARRRRELASDVFGG